MSVAVGASGAIYFVSGMSVAEVRSAIEAGEELRVWWFQSNGQRYTESMWFPEERIDFVRTESDDG